MDIKGIKYIAPVFDVSGYAEAARNYILALHSLGVPITITPVSFEQGSAEIDKEDEIILKSLVNKSIDYNIVLIHLTVEHYQRFIESDKINIGYSIWETHRISDEWVNWINSSMDLIFTASDWGVDVYKKSGVYKPIIKIPHCINIKNYEDVEAYKVSGVPEDAYKFYAIFQFIERKNPVALLKAYWSAFQNNENVALIIKTYRANFSEDEKKAIRTMIRRIKDTMVFDNFPPVYLILDKLSRNEILGLHNYCDCLVHTDRGEGWGLSPFTAGAMGNPIIVTGWGGITEYAKSYNSYLVDYVLEPVFGMSHISPFYNSTQLWAYPSIFQASQSMKYVYEHPEEAKEMGKKLQYDIIHNFNHTVVGNQIVEAIKAL